MAGSIFLSKELRLPVSTQQFGYLVERIRPAFDTDEQEHLREIYSPMDEGGMNFISAEHEGEAGFKALFYAVVKANSIAASEDNYGSFAPLWSDLLAKIRVDPRFSIEWESSAKQEK